MSIKIGIPSGLLNFEYEIIWDTFYREIEATVIKSGPTNREILDKGIESCVAEACLPVKIYHGHVIKLIDKVDYILIPRYTSISTRKYICPKFGGLPDLIRNSIDNLPEIIIFMDNTVVSDFSMNTVCAAGTGSFLDRQADRLNIPIEKLGGYALRSQNPVRIAGRCAVFAESDMIHKQQAGHCVEDIISGLCDALARNFINNLAKGKKIEPPVIFQGGVAANIGIVKAFEKNLQCPVIVPENYDVMGAFGCAILAREKMHGHDEMSNFYGFEIFNKDYFSSSVHCNDCPNICEIVEIRQEESIIARWGDRCGKWSQV